MARIETRGVRPLSGEEIERTSALLKAHPDVPDGIRFAWITVDEWPADKALPLPRRAEALLYDRPNATVLRAHVDLDLDEVVDVVRVPGVQCSIIYEEYAIAAEVVRRDPDVAAALARRGVTDLSKVQIDPWATGNFGLEHERGRRVVRATMLYREYPEDNGYAHPIDNLIAFVDLNERRVVRLEDHGVVPIPPLPGPWEAERNRPWREPLKPLEIVQPDGPSFTIDGNDIAWDAWRLTAFQHPVDGLVLRDIRWHDGERERSVIARASLAEMIVPYGETHPCHGFKHVLDCGEYGFGPMANSLALGCDCLGEIRYLDAHFAGPDGETMTTRNAICIHEEDYGILWKHYDHFTDVTEVRRSRRLVVSSIHTVGNYEYGIFWYLYLDGSIQLEVKLTGVLNTMAIETGAPLRHARRLNPQLAAPHHQHLFSFRLDMEVDGRGNSVYEIDSVALPASAGDNPYGSAFVAEERLLAREREAIRDANAETARYWEIRNPAVRNAVGEPVGYRLKLHSPARMLALPESAVSRRGTFGRHNLWVTAYDPVERKAAGDYPNQHPGGDGLPRFVESDAPLDDADVVLWVTVGTTHISRPEDFPVMPCEYVGFVLQPCGFFDRNPAMDLPPTHGHGSCASA